MRLFYYRALNRMYELMQKFSPGGARKDANRRDMVNDSLADLSKRVDDVNNRLDMVFNKLAERLEADNERWDKFIARGGRPLGQSLTRSNRRRIGPKKWSGLFLG